MDITHNEFRNTDDYFKKCCEAIGIEPTIRQASKFRNNRGKAYAEGRKMVTKDVKVKE